MSATPWYIKAVLRLALPAACLAALYLSIPGEIALAKSAGWSDHYAPAMPICLSVYALAAGAISTYRRKMKLPGQFTALIGALMALMLAMSAQSISHLIAQSYMEGSAILTVAVSCIPPLVIGHLVHMAETPSAVQSAAEELEELREVAHNLMTEVAASQAVNLALGTAGVLRSVKTVTEIAADLTGETKELNGRLQEAIEEEEGRQEAGEKQKRRHLALTRDKIEETRKSLAAQGEKVTVDSVCKALRISPATYYRYNAA
ncbi:hypothetical protein ABZ916_25925 [Streptomyces sp. NPDC046853]|uniref:hypothetical protein n=1 Tax=Streptomyces sp. NPDC046853 TaxID=3154920 RepID=UPI00340E3E7A